MGKQKTHHDVLGWQIDCPNYQECPMCYGCRAYDSSYVKCRKCYESNQKLNICNTKLHTEANLSKMIKREVIEITTSKSNS